MPSARNSGRRSHRRRCSLSPIVLGPQPAAIRRVCPRRGGHDRADQQCRGSRFGGRHAVRGTPGEDVFAYVCRHGGRFDRTRYQQIVGAANEFKEGDQLLGLAAADDVARRRPGNCWPTRGSATWTPTRCSTTICTSACGRTSIRPPARTTAAWTFGQLRRFLLERTEDEIKVALAGPVERRHRLRRQADVERRVDPRRPEGVPPAAGQPDRRAATSAPASSRIRPPTTWMTSAGRSLTAGPTRSATSCWHQPGLQRSRSRWRRSKPALLDLARHVRARRRLPHCVLAHIDIQAEVEARHPGHDRHLVPEPGRQHGGQRHVRSDASRRCSRYAASGTGRYGLYFETGQGADFTNGHGQGTDMVIHESRKYGFARLLQRKVAEAQRRAGRAPAPWVHVNDVAGFIGPGGLPHPRAARPLLPGRHRRWASCTG